MEADEDDLDGSMLSEEEEEIAGTRSITERDEDDENESTFLFDPDGIWPSPARAATPKAASDLRSNHDEELFIVDDDSSVSKLDDDFVEVEAAVVEEDLDSIEEDGAEDGTTTAVRTGWLGNEAAFVPK